MVQLASELALLAADALQLSARHPRTAGHTWQELGDLLGVSRQAALQRFGRPIDPRRGESMRKTMLPDAGPRAVTLLADWADARYEAVLTDFDETMTRELPADKLAEGWARLVMTVGDYQGMAGEPLVRQLGGYTVADVPMSFGAHEMKGRVAFGRAGKIAGLFVLTPEVPEVPEHFRRARGRAVRRAARPG